MKLIKAISIFLVCLITLYSSNLFPGNKLIFIIFSTIINFFLYYSIFEKKNFFHTYLFTLLWLGFWFKLIISLNFYNAKLFDGTGDFNYYAESFNLLLILSSIAFTGFFLPIYFFKKKYKRLESLSPLRTNVSFYSKYRIHFWFIFIIIILLYSGINYHFGIYQRGRPPQTLTPFYISGTLRWLLLFGGASISTLILRYEYVSNKIVGLTPFFLLMIETFLSSVSILSRGMIFPFLVILYGCLITESNNKHFKTLNFTKVTILTIGICLFISSLKIINFNREILFQKDRGQEISKPKNTNTRFIGIAITRWVGIEGLAAVIGKREKLSSDLLIEALKEKASTKKSFYDREIIQSLYTQSHLKSNNFITVQGMISFLYYSGSKIFLFTACFLIGLLCRTIEIIALKASKGNLIFTSLISYILAFRVIHFGYAPSQSYLLMSAIIINIIIFYIIESGYLSRLLYFFKSGQKA
ncbi:hypothetical protein [Halobacteriovorax sp. DPLXC-1]|uniref:hypothetical protein n=1 Tax=Halobacteriovorax sp. DPLXC-1 TaxID=3110771 RepID=UPI002FF14A9A